MKATAQRNRNTTRRRRKIVRRLALLFLALGIGTSIYTYFNLTSQHTHDKSEITILIRPGSSGRQIITTLHSQKIIRHKLPLLLYLTLSQKSSSLRAGAYRFPSPISPLQVIEKLARGEVASQRITFPEGFNRFDIAEVISRLPLNDAEQALMLTKDTSLITDLDPLADSLEGYLFPDTYEYTDDTSAAELIAKMVSRFRQVYNQDFLDKTKTLGMTVRQVVTLASLVEKEAKVATERAVIASVFHNRLEKGMRLDCDPTVQYAAILAGKNHQLITRSDLARESPYNTYLNPGLPPGPIASPGRSSLEAALNPAKTDFLFFVVDGSRSDGSHRFATSLTEHEANVAVYRRAQMSQQRTTQ